MSSQCMEEFQTESSNFQGSFKSQKIRNSKQIFDEPPPFLDNSFSYNLGIFPPNLNQDLSHFLEPQYPKNLGIIKTPPSVSQSFLNDLDSNQGKNQNNTEPDFNLQSRIIFDKQNTFTLKKKISSSINLQTYNQQGISDYPSTQNTQSQFKRKNQFISNSQKKLVLLEQEQLFTNQKGIYDWKEKTDQFNIKTKHIQAKIEQPKQEKDLKDSFSTFLPSNFQQYTSDIQQLFHILNDNFSFQFRDFQDLENEEGNYNLKNAINTFEYLTSNLAIQIQNKQKITKFISQKLSHFQSLSDEKAHNILLSSKFFNTNQRVGKKQIFLSISSQVTLFKHRLYESEDIIQNINQFLEIIDASFNYRKYLVSKNIHLSSMSNKASTESNAANNTDTNALNFSNESHEFQSIDRSQRKRIFSGNNSVSEQHSRISNNPEISSFNSQTLNQPDVDFVKLLPLHDSIIPNNQNNPQNYQARIATIQEKLDSIKANLNQCIVDQYGDRTLFDIYDEKCLFLKQVNDEIDLRETHLLQFIQKVQAEARQILQTHTKIFSMNSSEFCQIEESYKSLNDLIIFRQKVLNQVGINLNSVLEYIPEKFELQPFIQDQISDNRKAKLQADSKNSQLIQTEKDRLKLIEVHLTGLSTDWKKLKISTQHCFFQPLSIKQAEKTKQTISFLRVQFNSVSSFIEFFKSNLTSFVTQLNFIMLSILKNKELASQLLIDFSQRSNSEDLLKKIEIIFVDSTQSIAETCLIKEQLLKRSNTENFYSCVDILSQIVDYSDSIIRAAKENIDRISPNLRRSEEMQFYDEFQNSSQKLESDLREASYFIEEQTQTSDLDFSQLIENSKADYDETLTKMSKIIVHRNLILNYLEKTSQSNQPFLQELQEQLQLLQFTHQNLESLCNLYLNFQYLKEENFKQIVIQLQNYQNFEIQHNLSFIEEMLEDSLVNTKKNIYTAAENTWKSYYEISQKFISLVEPLLRFVRTWRKSIKQLSQQDVSMFTPKIPTVAPPQGLENEFKFLSSSELLNNENILNTVQFFLEKECDQVLFQFIGIKEELKNIKIIIFKKLIEWQICIIRKIVGIKQLVQPKSVHTILRHSQTFFNDTDNFPNLQSMFNPSASSTSALSTSISIIRRNQQNLDKNQFSERDHFFMLLMISDLIDYNKNTSDNILDQKLKLMKGEMVTKFSAIKNVGDVFSSSQYFSISQMYLLMSSFLTFNLHKRDKKIMLSDSQSPKIHGTEFDISVTSSSYVSYNSFPNNSPPVLSEEEYLQKFIDEIFHSVIQSKIAVLSVNMLQNKIVNCFNREFVFNFQDNSFFQVFALLVKALNKTSPSASVIPYYNSVSKSDLEQKFQVGFLHYFETIENFLKTKNIIQENYEKLVKTHNQLLTKLSAFLSSEYQRIYNTLEFEDNDKDSQITKLLSLLQYYERKVVVYHCLFMIELPWIDELRQMKSNCEKITKISFIESNVEELMNQDQNQFANLIKKTFGEEFQDFKGLNKQLNLKQNLSLFQKVKFGFQSQDDITFESQGLQNWLQILQLTEDHLKISEQTVVSASELPNINFPLQTMALQQATKTLLLNEQQQKFIYKFTTIFN